MFQEEDKARKERSRDDDERTDMIPEEGGEGKKRRK
jgi:hypothetical protein